MRLGRTQRTLPLYYLGATCALLLSGCSDGEGPSAPPAAIEVVAGDEQRAPAGTALPLPVRVRVVDVEGQGMRGIRVDFTITLGGGQVAPASAFTNTLGELTVTWTLGPETGEHRLEAATPVLSLDPVTVTAFAIAGEGAPSR